jgi:tetratricopeptide (TPR) repeat protein
MEAIIIFIIIGIIGFLIYQSLPSTKFEKAKSLMSSQKINEAINILNVIFDKHPEAPLKLAECKLKQGLIAKSTKEDNAKVYFSEILKIKERLPNKANKKKFEIIEAKAFFEISQINFNQSISESNIDKKISKLTDNIRFIASATKTGVENDFNLLKTKHEYELGETHFYLGIKSEKTGRFVEAIRNYANSANSVKVSSNSKIFHDAKTRIAICKLKNDEIIDLACIENVKATNIQYQRDFFFRYAKKLLNLKEYSEAETIISTYLNFNSPAIDKLKEILKIKKIKDAIKRVKEINYNLDQLYEKSFPVEDTRTLYDSLDNTIVIVKEVIPDLADKIVQLKPSLFNRLLSHYISVEKYTDAINLIHKFSSFWESPEMLKDIGICCFGFVTQGNLNEKNYRIIISNWLTSVFSDNVILKSLDSTTWDDSYTFTLIDSKGANFYQHEDIPDNVNFNETSETNISIGSTQQELIEQFEMILHSKTAETSFTKEVYDFYVSEKTAIERIVSIINIDLLFASPTFARNYGINESIIKALDDDYVKYSDEESLDAGIPYLKSQTDTFVREYSSAKDVLTKIVSGIENENLSSIEAVVSDRKKVLVQKYISINDTLEDLAFNAFAMKIKKNEDNGNLIPLMEICIQFANQNQKLKYQYSNFVANYCISKVNKKKIDNFQALGLMKKSYLYSADNPRICNNFITLINFNLMDVLNDRTNKSSEIYKILDDIYLKRSSVFIQSTGELAESRLSILSELRKSGVDISLIDGNPFSPNLNFSFNTSLTPEGIKLKKVISYLKKLCEGNSTSSSLKDPLELLRQQLGLNF